MKVVRRRKADEEEEETVMQEGGCRDWRVRGGRGCWRKS